MGKESNRSVAKGECQELWKIYTAKEVMWKNTGQNNSWAASYEEKWRHVPKN